MVSETVKIDKCFSDILTQRIQGGAIDIRAREFQSYAFNVNRNKLRICNTAILELIVQFEIHFFQFIHGNL